MCKGESIGTSRPRPSAAPENSKCRDSDCATVLRRRVPSEGKGRDGDCAAGLRRHVSLSAPGFLPYACTQVPGLITLGLLSLLAVAYWHSRECLFLWTAALGIYVAFWTTNMGVSGAIGAWRMRKATAEDWDAKLKYMQDCNPNETDVMHIVILPNYKEDEIMLQQTLENIARSAVAREQIHVILAMEAREDAAAKKAERLINRTSHLFADVTASFHPADIPNEVAGKSSNTQWAYREALRCYAPVLWKRDPSRVFVSVADADTLWHPQFFSALAYQGLSMPPEERVWTVWQPPIFPTRNLFSVPGVIRLSGLATILFELSGLANQHFGTHITHSTYSMTLALVSHREVAGWDTDVIAEDHHMFCKLYFAALWDSVCGVTSGSASDNAVIEPKVKLDPIFLPAISYLVESSDGARASLYARFEQAKRHSYGVVELGYVVLQYVQLIRTVGPLKLSLRTHTGILSIAQKMITVHIVNTVQAVSLLITAGIALFSIISWLFSEGFRAILHEGLQQAVVAATTSGVTGMARSAFAAVVGPMGPAGTLIACTNFIIVLDLLEGRYALPPPLTPKQLEAKDSLARKDDVELTEKPSPMSLQQKMMLFAMFQYETWTLAEPTVVLFGMVPELMAIWSLFRRSHFEYVVGAKPVTVNLSNEKDDAVGAEFLGDAHM